MAIQVDSTKAALASKYTDLGQFFGLATDDPGTNAQPMNEAYGSNYSRAQPPMPWSPDDAGVVTVQCPIKGDANITYTHVILCSGMSGANMIDNCPIGDGGVTLAGNGQIIVNATYTQS
jgi:hypothetical protein